MQYQPQETELCGRRIAALSAIDVAQCRKLALLCSERCPGNVILKAYDFVRQVRGSDLALVSGFHSLIEKDCLSILLRGSDAIIIVHAHKLLCHAFCTVSIPPTPQEEPLEGEDAG